MSISAIDLEFVLNENSGPILVLNSDPAALQENVASLQNESVVSFEEVSVFYEVVQNVMNDLLNEIDMEIVNKILKCSFYYMITKEEQSWLIEMNTISRFFELTQENNSCFVFSYYLNNTEWEIWIMLMSSLIKHLVSVLRILFNSPDYLLIHHVESFMKILILAQTPEAAKPFNQSALIQEMNNTSGNNPEQSAYLVDVNGCVDLPVLGRMTVEGMTTLELKNKIKQELIQKNLIKEPVVQVRILNFKVMMLGEVKSPGAIEVKGERITLLDAISQAGDLTMQGRRDRVAVIREEAGKRTVHYLDLKSKAIFDSPYFYLQQNDVVYVEPNDVKSVQYRSGQLGNVTPWISVLSSMLSLVTLIVAFK